MNKIITLFLILILKSFQKSDVYFTKEISGEKIVEIIKKKLNIKKSIIDFFRESGK